MTQSSEEEHRERLEAMVEDNGQTWDLSDNDKAAIRWAIAERLASADHDCMEATQEFRLQNDREWREKLEHLKAERDEYLAALSWIATFNTEGRPEHVTNWLRTIVERARKALQCDLLERYGGEMNDSLRNGRRTG